MFSTHTSKRRSTEENQSILVYQGAQTERISQEGQFDVSSVARSGHALLKKSAREALP